MDLKTSFTVENFDKFFNDIVEFDKYVEVRIFDLQNKYNPFSKYATNLKELKMIMKEFKKERWLLYYGINTRPLMSRKNDNVNYRRLFYFDIEHEGEKPPLADGDYLYELEKTIVFVSNYLDKHYGLKPCALTVSGRGYHLYYKHELIDNKEYKHKFRQWYKGLQEEMDKVKPVSNIKFMDSVFNSSRIAALPGSYNYKYEEKPFRNIIFVNDEVNTIKHLLDEVKVKKVKRGKFNVLVDEYDDANIRSSPEYQLCVNYDNLPEGNRNCHLVFAFQLLCRDCNITIMDELYEELVNSGYDGSGLVYPSEEYVYNTNIVNNWCCDNYEWCVDNNFKLPYVFSEGVITPFFKVDDYVSFPDTSLKTVGEVVAYVKQFNINTLFYESGVPHVYYDCLVNKLKQNCSSKLFKFVETNLLNSIITLRS